MRRLPLTIEQRTVLINQLQQAFYEYYPAALEAFEERLWYELFHAGFTEADVQTGIRYLQREIRHGPRSIGALKLSNLLQPDRFEEDLNISRVALRALKVTKESTKHAPPPPTREEKEAARKRGLEILARFRAEHGL